jgi:DNA-directed RNA polymerase specialized sigma24 family protein/CheY-like chemotaxis protein
VSVSQIVSAQIPSLRRFARALTGSQKSGDAYVTETLEALLADPSLIPTETDVKARLYKLFLAMWNSVEVNQEDPAAPDLRALDRTLQAISPGPRQAFLLTALEGFSVKDAARAMLVSEEKCQRLIDEADREIAVQAACDVLIIEDEPLIALEVTEIAASMGHKVRHVARTHREAIAAVQKHRPDLVLADIQLADGSSGLDAVEEILRSVDVPVIFITAFPERLLTGKKPEPTYLVEKPFRVEKIKALISQALFFHAPRPRG